MRTIHVTDRQTELALKELEEMIQSGVGHTTAVEKSHLSILNKTGNHVMGSEDGVFVDTTAGDRTVYLNPAPSSGSEYIVGNRGGKTLTVNGSGRMINGDTTLVLLFNNSTVQLVYNGTEWGVK